MDTETTSFGRHAPAHRVLVHLSDTHLLADGAPLGGRYDVERTLAGTLAAVDRLGVPPDAIVVTGDLADLGEPDAYRRLRAAIEPVAQRLGSPLVWVAGNHDERPALRRELLDAPATEEPVTGVVDLNGLRLIVLDTTVPGWHHGDLDRDQLDWLRRELARPAPLGTILAMHHPPLPSHVPLFDILELRDTDGLEQAIEGSDVRMILAGHLHYSTTGTFAGVPVSVAAATCYTMDLANPPQQVNGMDAGQSFHLVHVYDDVVTSSVVPVAGAPSAGFFDDQWYRRMAALSAQERLELFSRKRPRSG